MKYWSRKKTVDRRKVMDVLKGQGGKGGMQGMKAECVRTTEANRRFDKAFEMLRGTKILCRVVTKTDEFFRK